MICVHERRCLFGRVSDGEMILNATGRIAAARWCDIPAHFPAVCLDAFVIMPNHVHGILVFQYTPVESLVQRDENRLSLGTVVGAFKSAAAKEINLLRGTPGAKVWQDRFHDHIVRGDADLDRIREYIELNPANWMLGKDELFVPDPIG
jgi:REP element-mobilizing transposase RayT